MDRGHIQFFVEVHTITETITYKIQSRLWNGMLSAPNISTGGSLDKLSIEWENQSKKIEFDYIPAEGRWI